jgi:DNA (cytosine-5)-methyltransferase 1
MMYFLSLCAGIGGFDLAAYRAGLRFDGHYFSEVDRYAIDVFQKRFPESIPLGDIRRIDYGKLPKGEWVVTGGPPCQPFSVAGKRLMEKDGRNMWPEAIMAVRELRPRVAVFENVYGVIDYLDGYVLPEIESEGYKTETICIPACAFGAKHKRNRWFVVAYPKSERLPGIEIYGSADRKNNYKTNEKWKQLYKTSYRDNKIFNWEEIESELCGDDDGLSFDVERFKCLGNAIVPQCAEVIFMLPVFDRWRLEEEVYAKGK